ncbi:MAG: alpha/beta hydrolase family protein [Promethearchaeota archaeon]
MQIQKSQIHREQKVEIKLHKKRRSKSQELKNLKGKILLTGILFIILLGLGYIQYKEYRKDLRSKKSLVNIQKFQIETDPGVKITFRLFVPWENNTDLPAVIIQHGLSSKKEAMFSMALEFCRRGFVVITPDLRNHGESTGYCTLGNKESDDIGKIINFVWTHINGTYVRNITGLGLVGHSLGALTVSIAAYKFNVTSCVALSPPPNITDFILNYYGFDYGVLSQVGHFYNDFGNPEYVKNTTLYTYIRNRTRNSLPHNYLIISSTGDNLITFDSLYKMFSEEIGVKDPEIGKIYGSFEDNNATELLLFDGISHGDMVYTYHAPNITRAAILWTERVLLGENGSEARGDIDVKTDFIDFSSIEIRFQAIQDMIYGAIIALAALIIFWMEYYYERVVHVELHVRGIHPRIRATTGQIVIRISRSIAFMILPAFIIFPLYLKYFPYDETALFLIQPLVHSLKAITIMWIVSYPIILYWEETERRKFHMHKLRLMDRLGFFYSIKDAIYAIILGFGFSLSVIYGLEFLNKISEHDTLLKIPFRAEVTVPFTIIFIVNGILTEGWFRCKIQRKFRTRMVGIPASAIIQGLTMGTLFFIFTTIKPLVTGGLNYLINVTSFGLEFGFIVFAVYTLVGLINASIFEYLQSIFAGVIFNGLFIPWLISALLPVF